MSLELRVTELETRLAFQDDALQQLSDELLVQSRLIERLQRQIEVLASRQAELVEQVGNAVRETGTVKWFNTSKGFGFISRDDGEDIFVHFRAIRGEGHRVLVEGQRVEFSVVMRDKGLQAEDVTDENPDWR